MMLSIIVKIFVSSYKIFITQKLTENRWRPTSNQCMGNLDVYKPPVPPQWLFQKSSMPTDLHLSQQHEGLQHKYSFSTTTSNEAYLLCRQCDQICRYFATLATFMNLCQMFDGLFSVWQNFEPTLAKLYCFWATFQCCTCPNIAK